MFGGNISQLTNSSCLLGVMGAGGARNDANDSNASTRSPRLPLRLNFRYLLVIESLKMGASFID